MDISVVDLNRVEVYEAGASLITLLAYPREREEVWAQVHASLCSYALRIKSASEPNWATVPQPMKPIYAFRLQQGHQSGLADARAPNPRSDEGGGDWSGPRGPKAAVH